MNSERLQLRIIHQLRVTSPVERLALRKVTKIKKDRSCKARMTSIEVAQSGSPRPRRHPETEPRLRVGLTDICRPSPYHEVAKRPHHRTSPDGTVKCIITMRLYVCVFFARMRSRSLAIARSAGVAAASISTTTRSLLEAASTRASRSRFTRFASCLFLSPARPDARLADGPIPVALPSPRSQACVGLIP